MINLHLKKYLGEDYPIFAFPPDTSFLCAGHTQGYYADPEADCQSFHICANLGDGDLTKYSLLCPNGTLFNQQYFICDWWFNVDCSLSESFYSLNDDIAAEQAANSPEGGLGVLGAGGDITALTTSYLPSYPSTPPNQVNYFNSIMIMVILLLLIFTGKWNSTTQERQQRLKTDNIARLIIICYRKIGQY